MSDFDYMEIAENYARHKKSLLRELIEDAWLEHLFRMLLDTLNTWEFGYCLDLYLRMWNFYLKINDSFS